MIAGDSMIAVVKTPTPVVIGRRKGLSTVGTCCRALLLWLALACCLPNLVVADVLWLKDGSVVYGRVVERSDSIRFRISKADGSLSETVEYPADQVASIRVNINEERLQRLSIQKGSVRAYLEYAEELSAEHRDPVAKALAWRLFLLAATHGSDRETQSALHGLAGLEKLAGLESSNKNGTADRRIEILLLLHSDRRGPTRSGKNKSVGESRFLSDDNQLIQPPNAEDSQTMLQLVRAIRRDQTQAAINLLNQPRNQSVWPKWSQQISLADLNAMARKGKLTAIDVRRLLSIELSIERRGVSDRSTGEESASATKSGKQTWAEQAYQTAGNAIVLPSIETIAQEWQVDLRATHYRNGQWRIPTEPRVKKN